MGDTDEQGRTRAPMHVHQAPQGRPSGQGSGYRVLHIEDDPADARFVGQLLTLQEPLTLDRIDTVGSKAAALAAVTDRGPYDVVLVDLHLPDNDDGQLVDHILTHSPSSAVMVLTADDRLEVGVDALQRGAAQFLPKSRLDEVTLAREIRFAVERKAYDLRLRNLTRTDELTGVANRRALLEFYDAARSTVVREQATLVVAYYDLNDFKPVNDLFGHLTGDQVLRVVAERLQRGVRPGDLVVRMSGDEFVVVGLTSDDAAAVGFASRLTDLVGRVPIGVGDATVTAAVGVVTSDGSAPLDDVLARADAAMYRNKRELR